MSILAVDRYGRLYETSPDRADGRGYKRHATAVDQTDLTLGSVYTKSQMGYTWQVMRERAAVAAQDQADQVRRQEQRERLGRIRAKQLNDEYLMDCDLYKRNLLRQALNMSGCSVAGRSSEEHRRRPDQRAIRSLVTGMGADVSQRISKQEATQKAHEARMAQQLAVAALRDAQRERVQLMKAQAQRVRNAALLKSYDNVRVLKGPAQY